VGDGLNLHKVNAAAQVRSHLILQIENHIFLFQPMAHMVIPAEFPETGGIDLHVDFIIGSAAAIEVDRFPARGVREKYGVAGFLRRGSG